MNYVSLLIDILCLLSIPVLLFFKRFRYIPLSLALFALQWLLWIEKANPAGFGDYNFPIINNYEFVDCGGSQKEIVHSSDLDADRIGCEVVRYNWTKNYILAERRPEKFSWPPGTPDPQAGKKEDESEKEYWIVDTGSKKVYGPLTIEEFGRKKRELGISDRIKLKTPEDRLWFHILCRW